MYPGEPLHLKAIVDGRIFFQVVIPDYFLQEWVTRLINLLDLFLGVKAHMACFCVQSRAVAHCQRLVHILIFFY